MSHLPQEFVKSAKKCSFKSHLLKKETPHLVIKEDKVLSFQKTKGIELETKVRDKKVFVKLLIKEKVENPLFLCFGVLKPEGKQIIIPEIVVEEDARVDILAHCSFPQAENVVHEMEAEVKVKKGGSLNYTEKHFHGEKYGARVVPVFNVTLEEKSNLKAVFSLNTGSIGKLDIDFKAELKKEAVCEVVTKAVGKGKKDRLKINDKLILEGENSRGLVKIRTAAVEGGRVFARGETIALAKGSRGHVDCQEILVGENSVARAVPVIEARHPESRVTHEATVGKISQKELELLMTRGLTEEEAVDFLIKSKIN